METEAPPTEAPKQPAPPPHSVPGGGEESEAKLRERLIERTKKLRVAVTDKTLTLPDTEPPAQVLYAGRLRGTVYTVQVLFRYHSSTLLSTVLTLSKPRAFIYAKSLHKSIIIMAIILGVNMLYINFCLFKEIPMAPRGLSTVSVPF